MLQRWSQLLFAHWPVPVDLLRPYLPPRLTLDTFEGQAWLGVVPFTMSHIRPLGLPTVPGLSALHELNVRTYATLDGVPGVWFLSLDATSALAVWAARTAFHLPYLRCRMTLEEQAGVFTAAAERTHRGAAPASFRASWEAAGPPLPPSRPGTLEHFLTERYHLYTAGPDARPTRLGAGLWRGTLAHAPWQLRPARLLDWASNLVESHGLPTPVGPPLLHLAETVDVRIMRFGRLVV